ncbi:MAG: L-glyceraldehyde 3-phosphate reductase [Bacteroidales bacterium]|nr:L-glyceraldehyde 3-phosphate reductase [Bacteroidales bacterium]
MINPVYTAAEDRYECGMKYRRCGKSGIMLPEISLGLWQNFGETAPLARSREMLLHAFDKGVCHFDLANNYGPSYGSAESTFGKIISSDLRPYRDELFISTKAGYDMWPGPYGNLGSRKYLMSSLDQSLKRMNLDHVDIFYSHRFDPDTPLQETMQALVDIVRSGKALYAGISNYPHDAAEYAYRYLSEHDVPCLLHQVKYNMMHRIPETEDLLEQAKEAGSGLIAFSPLAQGLLTDRYLGGIPSGSRAARDFSLKASTITPELQERLRKLNEMAAERGQSLAQMALAWTLKNGLVTSVIIGASSIAQIDDNLKAMNDTRFSAEELEMIDRIIG